MRFYAFVVILVGLANAASATDLFFQSPSGNIRCTLTDVGEYVARCDLEVDRQSYLDRPLSCDGDWGTSFQVGSTGPGALHCATSEIGGPSNPVPLPYGAAAVFAGVTCRSAETGVTCTNAEGGGFSVRRAEQRIF